MIRRFRSLYGASPLHLLVLLACFALAGAGVVGWHLSPGDFRGVLAWFVAALLAHDFVLLPLYSLLDRIAFSRARSEAVAGADEQPAAARSRRRALGIPVSAVPYVRVPALLSALLLITFFPLIARRASAAFEATNGVSEQVYLARWLAVTGVMFALSALAYAFAMRRARQGRDPGAGPRRRGRPWLRPRAGVRSRTPPSQPGSPPAP